MPDDWRIVILVPFLDSRLFQIAWFVLKQSIQFWRRVFLVVFVRVARPPSVLTDGHS